jgi:hypothetical protein
MVDGPIAPLRFTHGGTPHALAGPASVRRPGPDSSDGGKPMRYRNRTSARFAVEGYCYSCASFTSPRLRLQVEEDEITRDVGVLRMVRHRLATQESRRSTEPLSRWVSRAALDRDVGSSKNGHAAMKKTTAAANSQAMSPPPPDDPLPRQDVPAERGPTPTPTPRVEIPRRTPNAPPPIPKGMLQSSHPAIDRPRSTASSISDRPSSTRSSELTLSGGSRSSYSASSASSIFAV